MGISQNEFQFMVESMTADLIERMIKQEHYGFKEAVDTVYSSDTYAALLRPETCLYYQSAGYVMHYLMNEIKTGKIND